MKREIGDPSVDPGIVTFILFSYISSSFLNVITASVMVIDEILKDFELEQQLIKDMEFKLYFVHCIIIKLFQLRLSYIVSCRIQARTARWV